ncbi:MAG TPA: hypothetical protein VFA20_07800 [Myxococcaceae bacterium]|nr:hypothetical protein [Myxococcaceae bacterium]
MSALLLAATLLAAAPAPAAEPPPPLSPGLEGAPVRVERRLLVKNSHFFFTLGADYFIRGDYYVSPGVVGAASFYLTEHDGLDIKVGAFLSFMSPAAQVVFQSVHLIPDAQRPVALLVAGYRRSVGYGKVMLNGLMDSLLHFDLQIAGHAGIVITDRMASPALSVAPALLVRFSDRWFAQVDVELYASYETRQSAPFVVGILPTFTAGVVL